ncbi:hypothetical protein N665_3651s0002, partial [Sinapis alba]
LYTLKKQYEIYCRITFGSTGLGFNSRTWSIDAPEHCYFEASKLRSHPLRFLPLLDVVDVVFRDETIVVEESWQQRRGVHHRTPQIQNDSHDLDHMEQEDTNWLQTPMKDTPNVVETDHVVTSQQSMKDTSHRKRKRNPMDSTLDRIAATMEDRNGILEQMASSTSKTKSKNATEERMALVSSWASLDVIAANDIVRGLFMALIDDEKLPFLKRQTKESCNDFFYD